MNKKGKEVIYYDLKMRTNYIKENNTLKESNYCPFCDEDELNRNNKIDYGNGVCLIENKFQVNKGCKGYLLIENYDCNKTFHNSNKEHVLKLLSITEDIKNKFESSGEYEEVVVFKQFGKFSGSSVVHGHIQIVGMNGISSDKKKIENSRLGIVLFQNDSVKVIASSNPVGEGTEINIEYKTLNLEVIDKMQRVLSYYVDSSEGLFEGGNYSVSMHDIKDDYKMIKMINRKLSTTYKTNLGISLIPDFNSDYIDKLKNLFINS